jgi:diguanylate cyclase (GGDEF)-like protein
MKNSISFDPFPIPSPNALVGMKPQKKGRILIVDDEPTNVELLSRFLLKEGYDVNDACNGEEALVRIFALAPDLILLDVFMPVMDGLTLCRKLRSEISTRSLPIILLTSGNTLEDKLKGLQAGVDDYISKPFDLEEVKARLEGALQRRRWDLAVHPLTRLPGSPAIEDEVWKRLRIGANFAFAYIDIDHFKAYNDAYGYEAGDKVLKRLAGLLEEAVKLPPAHSAFVGHIGGDDFVFISTLDHMKFAMPKIAEEFDDQRIRFYRCEDMERGTIKTKNRQGQEQSFPLITLSVAIISTATRRILHYARLVEIASELKRYVKVQDHHNKSLILWDRRTDSPINKTSNE